MENEEKRTDLQVVEQNKNYHEAVAELLAESAVGLTLAEQTWAEHERKYRQMHNKGSSVNQRKAAAEDWYLKLGTLNSLYKQRSDLVLAATLQVSEGNKLATPSELMLNLGKIKPSIVNDSDSFQKKAESSLLASHMLIDATADPYPYPDKDPVDISLIGSVKQSTQNIIEDVKKDLIYKDRFRTGVPDWEKDLLAGALMLNFDTRFMELDQKQLTDWEGEFTRITSRGVMKGNQSEESAWRKWHELKKKDQIMSAEDYKEHTYWHELYDQASELYEIDGLNESVTNGLFNELYTTVLLRHTFLTKSPTGYNIKVRSTTDRQDQPLDGNRDGKEVGKLSYDVIVKGLPNNDSRFIQLKTYDIEPDGYFPGIDLINPFEGITDNSSIRTEGRKGLKQMLGLLRELVSDNFYGGDTEVVDKQSKLVLDKLGISVPELTKATLVDA